MNALALRQRPTLILLVGVVLVTLLINGDPAHMDTSIIIGIYSLIALSLGMVWGQAGVLSLAQAAFAAIGAYSAAITAVTWGWPVWTGLIGALLIPPLFAYPIARLTVRLTPLALAIATLAFGEVLYTVLREAESVTGGYIGLAGIPWLPFAKEPLAFHVLTWGSVAVVVAMYCNLAGSAWGTALRTMRVDHTRATADGINVPRATGTVLAFSSSVAGFAGWLYAHYISYVAPESLATTLSISVVLMVFIGGAGHVLGPVLGAVLLTLLQDNIPAASEMHGLIYGALVVAIIVLAPTGLLGFVDRGRTLFRRRRDDTPDRRTTPPTDGSAQSPAHDNYTNVGA